MPSKLEKALSLALGIEIDPRLAEAVARGTGHQHKLRSAQAFVDGLFAALVKPPNQPAEDDDE